MPRNRRDDDNDDDSGEHDRPAKPRRRDDDDSGERARPAKSRRRDDDDSGEHEKPKKKGGLPGWALALIIVGAVLFVCGGVAGVISYFVYSIGKGIADVASSIQKEDQESKKVVYHNIEMSDLMAEWKGNGVAAQRKYSRPNGVEFVGVLDSVGSNIQQKTYFMMRPAGVPKEQLGLFDKAHIFALDEPVKAMLSKCKVGDRIRVKAVANQGSVSEEPSLIADSIELVK